MPRGKKATPKTKEETPEVKEDDTVQVNKKDLDFLMNKLESQSKDIETLYKVADKSRLYKEKSRDEDGLISTFRVWTYKPEDKIIVAHKLISNVAELVNGRYYEDQRLQVVFEDNETKEMAYSHFIHNIDKSRIGEEVKRETAPDGDEILHLQLPDGKVIKVNKKFVN